MADARNVDVAIRRERCVRAQDAEIAALAGRQHGVVARWQLAGLGVSQSAIDRRLARGRLHLLHRGVHAVGHRVLTRDGHWMATVLAMGPGAVLSHRDAAALWGFRDDNRARIDVTTPRRVPSRPKIDVRSASLAPDEITAHHGIPVTTPHRTILDLAAVLPPHQVERAMNEAQRLRIGDTLSLDALLARYRRRRGTRAVRQILDAGRVGATITRSELEARFLAFLDARGLPRPETNVHLEIAGHAVEADCLWRAQRLIVELDGHAFHATAAAYETDRERDADLQAAGWHVLRVTWRRLHRKPGAVAANLAAFLCPP